MLLRDSADIAKVNEPEQDVKDEEEIKELIA